MTEDLPDHPDLVAAPPDGWKSTVGQIERSTTLSLNQAKVFYLCDVLGRTESDVAAIIGVSVGTVRSHKGRVRSKIREARQLVDYADGVDE